MRGLRIIAYLVVLGLVGAVSYWQYQSLDKTREKERDSADALEQKRVERDMLRAKVREAEAHVKHLKSDPLEVEAAIRDKKKYLRPGEVSIQIKELSGGIQLEANPLDPAAAADDAVPPPAELTPNEPTPTGAPTAPGH